LTISDGWLTRPQRHVGDVQQAVDAAQVDERAEVGDVLDRARDDVALLEGLEQARFASPRSRSMSLRRLMTMLRRSVSILRISARILRR
jgi:hypothetical protein